MIFRTVYNLPMVPPYSPPLLRVFGWFQALGDRKSLLWAPYYSTAVPSLYRPLLRFLDAFGNSVMPVWYRSNFKLLRSLRSSFACMLLVIPGKTIRRLPHPLPVTSPACRIIPSRSLWGCMPVFISSLANLTWRQPLATLDDTVPLATIQLYLNPAFFSPFRHVQIPAPSLRR